MVQDDTLGPISVDQGTSRHLLHKLLVRTASTLEDAPFGRCGCSRRRGEGEGRVATG